MPQILITSSLVLYFELTYTELLEFHQKYPNFLSEKLVNPGYSTLHLISSTFEDSLDEFLSWPHPDRDHYFNAMTQRKRAAPVKIISSQIDDYEIGNDNLELGTITVNKFQNVKEFVQAITSTDTFASNFNGCLTVLFIVNDVPKSAKIVIESQELFQKQLRLGLRPSALPANTDYSTIDWSRFAVSCSWGSEGEFRVDARRGGIFDLSNWTKFAGGWTQLYHLKAELSNVIGITARKCPVSKDAADTSNWLKKYRKISGNAEPPKKYKEWIDMAAEMGCETDPYHYSKIFEHLKPFKNRKSALSPSKIKDMEIFIRFLGPNLLEFITSKQMILQSRNDYPFYDIFEKVPKVIDPNIQFALVYHRYDEGMIIPSDDSSIQLYKDFSDVFERNSKFNEKYCQFRHRHSLLSVPATCIAIPYALPVFGSNRLSGFLDIMLPSRKNGLLASDEKQRQVALNSPEWSEKMNKAVFRGRTTGINFKQAFQQNIDLNISPRFKLHSMATEQKAKRLKCSVELDFGITDFWQYNGNEKRLKALTAKFPLVPHLDYVEQFKYKYLVIVDGNGWPDRVATFLLSGSLIFLSTLHEEWVIDQLIPGKHFIQVKADLSDLVEKLEWAASHDAEAKKIADAGKEFAIKNFDLKNVQVYNAFLMMEYQRLFESRDL